jgi:RHS repeat-associated protein
MRPFAYLALLGLVPASLLAQKSPKESARVYVGIQETIYSGQQVLMQVGSSVPAENTQGPGVMWANYTPDTAGIGTAVTSSNQFFQVYPGRLYTFLTASGAWNRADIHFSAPPGYTVYMGQYGWPMTARSTCLTPNFSGGTGSWQTNFYILPNDGVSWMAPGFARPPRISDTTWAISMGTLGCGASAGSLRWQSTSLNSALLDSSALNYACPTATVSAITSSYITGGPVGGSTPTWYTPLSIPDISATYYDANGNLKFVATNQAEFYISRNGTGANGGYTVQVYPGQTKFEWTGNNPANGWTFDPGVPYLDQYTVADPNSPGGTWSGSIQITKLQDGGAGSQMDVWTLTLADGTTTLTEAGGSRVTTIVSTGTSPRTENYTVADVSKKVSFYESKTYQTYPWGEELVSTVVDPSSLDGSGSALNLTTSYTYYNTTWGDGEYGKLQSVTKPDGSWIRYDYYTDTARLGQLEYVYTPWQDAPTTYLSATLTNCKVVTQLYNTAVYTGYQSATPTTSVFQTVSAGNQTAITGILGQQSSVSSSFWDHGTYDTPLFGNEPMRTDTIKAYSAAGVYQTTVQTVFDNCSDPVYNGKLYFQTNPDGTKTSASYWKGTFYSWLGSPSFASSYFVPISTAATWVSTYLIGTSTQQDSTAVQYTTDGISGGMPVDPVWMTPYKSFRRQTLTDQNGYLWYDVMEVFTGSAFQIISWHVTGHTPDGFLISDQDSSGSLTTYSYIDGKVNYQTKPDGTQTQYFFDTLMRVYQSEFKAKAASGSLPALGAVETYFTYDSLGHVLTTMKNPAGGGITLATAATYDLAGLPLTRTDASGVVTSYAYTNGGRTVTTTNPNGSTLTTDQHLDGSAKLVSGNGAVNQYSSSAVNTDGTITTTVYQGTAAPAGSSRWSSSQSDWLGRNIAQTLPAFNSTTVFNTKQSFYNTIGQLVKSAQTGRSATLYQYDGLGKLQYTALDVNNNGTIDLGGPDRITETRSDIFEDGSSVWWNRTQTSVFTTAGGSTPVLSSDVRQKLVPYASNAVDYENGIMITETDAYDYYGNLTTDVVNSASATAIVTETKTKPDSTVPQVSVTYNGALVSSQTTQNLTTTYQYDGLYRETSEIDPRTGTSSTAYFTTGPGQTGQVSSHTDAAGNATNYAYNASDGRLSCQTDPAGNTIYHGYDHLGREVKTWGLGTYPVESAFDIYGAKIDMRTFRVTTTPNFGTSSWPLSDDTDPQNPVATTWSSGDVTRWVFDSATGLLTTKTDPGSYSVTYTYYQDGNLQLRTWSRGTTTSYTYDANTAEQIGISYNDGTPGVTYAFDRVGHGTSVAQAYSGFTLTTGLSYNIPGKMLQKTFDSTYFAGRQLTYQFDTTDTGKLGRTIGFTLGTSSSPASDQGITFGFDTYGRFNSESVTSGPTFTYNYQANSNLLASIADTADGWSQSRGWEAHRNLLTSIETEVGTVNEGTFAYVYDNLGRRSSKVATGALFTRYSAMGLTDTYAYDSMSQVIGDQTYQSTSATSPTTPMLGRDFAYSYDSIGNRITSSIDSQTASYSTDGRNQIMTLTIPAYYPVSGLAPGGATSVTLNGTAIATGQFQGQYYLNNVAVSNSSAPVWSSVSLASALGGTVATNAFVPRTPEYFGYDLDGNLLSDGRWNYTWDGENRLLSMETYGHQTGQSPAVWTSGVPQVHLDFTYDYEGRRIDKKLSSWSGSAWVVATETRYAYENWNVVAEYSVSGSTLTLTNGFVWGMDISGRRHGADGVGGLLAMETASGLFELPVYDANGNVQGLTDRTSGAVTASYEYSPFGEALRANGSYALLNPFRFSTRFCDDETHLIYYGRRYYSPTLGRFLSRDPIEEKGGLHLYAFTANQPVNRWDIRGLSGNSLSAAQSQQEQYLAKIAAFLTTMRELNYSGNSSESSNYDFGDHGVTEGFGAQTGPTTGSSDGNVDSSIQVSTTNPSLPSGADVENSFNESTAAANQQLSNIANGAQDSGAASTANAALNSAGATSGGTFSMQINLSGTAFGGLAGVSGSVGAGFAIDTSGNAYFQIDWSTSKLVGFGAALMGGVGATGGYQQGSPSIGYSGPVTSSTVQAGFGVADVVTGEVDFDNSSLSISPTTTLNPGLPTFGKPVEGLGFAAFGAIGQTTTSTLTFPIPPDPSPTRRNPYRGSN